jgi:hypothetical protein
MLTPVIILNISPARWPVAPTPFDPKLSFPGFAFAPLAAQKRIAARYRLTGCRPSARVLVPFWM